jgi:hypothetical protein
VLNVREANSDWPPMIADARRQNFHQQQVCILQLPPLTFDSVLSARRLLF